MRLTVFVTPDTVVPGTLWQDVVGEEPENSAVQRATATRSESGSFADGTLGLQVQPMRIDWVHEPVGLGSEGASPPTFGPFPGAAEPLLELGRRWVRSAWFPATQRIALGFVLISATPDRQAGYRELTRFIDAVPKGSDATDFQYQVNRPRPSRAGISGLRVNRLSKWSVGTYQMVVVVGGSTNPTKGRIQAHLRLELDINTNPEYEGLIPRESIEGVLSDLFDGACEVYEHGDHLS